MRSLARLYSKTVYVVPSSLRTSKPLICSKVKSSVCACIAARPSNTSKLPKPRHDPYFRRLLQPWHPSRNLHIRCFASKSRMPAVGAIFSAVITLIRGLVTVFLLLASFPFLLSTAWGTQLASRAASRITTGHVDIDRIQLSWTKPVVVEGLRMHEGSSSSRQLVAVGKISSAGNTKEHGECAKCHL